ncbi:response regulator [Tsuneonella rigui]|jgi:two-component system phosphate regulon response regulator PhoB|uniref:response regulator n=1 Tax=Tsuneonella rigui TaxID=1708790 RepID=UPI000F7DEC3A|nr:response regulator [Tsuneonella rigui]
MALIFYAEDDALMGELVQATLMDAGHAVGVLGDGEDALRALRRRKPNLAIVDMSMPQMGGCELIKIVRRDPDLYDIPILVLTARRSKEDEEIARQAGANGYLRKPFEPERLVSMVNQLLEWAEKRSAPKPPEERTV